VRMLADRQCGAFNLGDEGSPEAGALPLVVLRRVVELPFGELME
jgi:hypothetical protein